jgi:hypothetical protein
MRAVAAIRLDLFALRQAGRRIQSPELILLKNELVFAIS